MLSKRFKTALLAAMAVLMLLPGAAFARDEMQNNDPNKYYIVLDTTNQVVTVYQKDDDGEYTRIVRRFVCTTGKTKPKGDEPASPTPSGTWKIGGRERFGKFAAFNNEYARYWTQIVGGVYFHSIMFSSRDTSTLKKFAFNNLGTNGSHGCVRLTVPDARWMWYHIAPGTECVIREGDPDDAETAAIRAGLTIAKAPEERVELSAGTAPYTDDWRVEDIPIEEKFRQGSQN